MILPGLKSGVSTSGEAADDGTTLGGKDTLLERIESLPTFVERERERGSGDDLPVLVRRFVRGEPLQPVANQSDPAAAARAARRVRLRELQRDGVDLSLMESTLPQTPLQRIANMERQLRFMQALQRARREQAGE